MQVAVVHSFYRSDQPSGENIAVLQQVEALRRGGIDVVELYRYTDDERRKPLFGLKSATSALTGIDWSHAKGSLDWRTVDVVNVHNTLPNFGTRWLAEIDTPVVSTIHNFRFTCANGLLYRNGSVCTECVARKPWSAIRHGCYQESRLKTVPVALGPRMQGATNPAIEASDMVIAQTERVEQTLVRVGIQRNRISLIPGFVEDRGSLATATPTKPRFVFVGRPSSEKGLQELLDIWPPGFALDVFGAGTPSASVARSHIKVSFKGAVDREAIRGRLNRYTALIFPGRVWEGALPLVVREALEAGIPVVALSGSSAAEFVATRQVGSIYLDGDPGSLRRGLLNAEALGEPLRRRCRSAFMNELSQNVWFEKIFDVFARVAGQQTKINRPPTSPPTPGIA